MMTPINGAGPPGDPGAIPCSGHHEHSLLVRLLPYFEQTAVYNSFNFNIHFQTIVNATAQAAGIQSLWCPSDPSVSQIDFTNFTWGMRFTSYKGNAGTWFTPGRYQDPACVGSPSARCWARPTGSTASTAIRASRRSPTGRATR